MAVPAVAVAAQVPVALVRVVLALRKAAPVVPARPKALLVVLSQQAALAILDPYPGGTLRPGLNPQAAALIMSIKRQSSMRPLREDHPHFDGSNPMSVATGLPAAAHNRP